MKSVRVMFDEDLLAALDQSADVRERGRSAVLRELTSHFLRQRREQEIDAQYERAYAGVKDPLGTDFGAWEGERDRTLLESDEAEQQETFAFLKREDEVE